MAKKQAPVRDPRNALLSTEDSAAVHDSPVKAKGQTDYLKILIERLRAGRVVLVAGSALSGGGPSWRGLVQKLLDTLAAKPDADASIAEARDLVGSYPLSVCGFLRRRLGTEFSSALTAALPAETAPSEASQLAAALPFRAILTTALDGALVKASQTSHPDVRVYNASHAEDVRRDGRGRYVMQLLGGTDDPQQVLFSESDLRRVLADDAFRALMGDLYGKRSFLFLGFHPADPDFGIVVDRVLVGAKAPPVLAGEDPAHFALMTGVPRVVQEEVEAAYGIHALPTGQFANELSLLRALHEALGDHPGEILPDDDDLEGWLRVLQQEPTRTDVLEKLTAMEARLEAAGDADRLIELHMGRAEVEPTPAGRAQYLRRVSKVFETSKGQMAEAFQSRLLAFKDDLSLHELDELERLASVSGQWTDLLGALSEAIPQLPPSSRAGVWLRVARLYGDKLHHTDYAMASLHEAAKLDSLDADLRVQLHSLRVDLARSGARWKELAEALGQLASELPSDAQERKIDLLLEQGELYDSRLSDGVAAMAAYQKAREVAPTNRDVLSASEQLLRRQKAWPALNKLLLEKAALWTESGDAAGALETLREAARLSSEHLGDAKLSIAQWSSVRQSAPTDLEALRALEKLYSHDSSTASDYLEILASLADVAPTDKERLALYRRLCAEYEDLPKYAGKAQEALDKILALDPAAEDAYRGLARLYLREKNWPSLVTTYERHIEKVSTGKVELLSALGRVLEVDIPAGSAEELRREAPQAIRVWQQVLDLQPDHIGALDALSRLYVVVEQPMQAVKAMEQRARLTEDKSQCAAQYLLAGRLCEKHQLDQQTTEECFIRALEAQPSHTVASQALAGLYERQHEFLRAAKVCTDAEALSQGRIEKLRYLCEAARLYLRAEDTDKAKGLYEQALKIDPEHTDATKGLADVLWQQKSYTEVLPLLEVLTKKEAPREEQVSRLCRLGEAAQLAQMPDRSLKAFLRALAVDADDLTSLAGAIPLLVQSRQFLDAGKLCRHVLTTHGATLTASEKTKYLAILGDTELQLDHKDSATKALWEALEIDPLHIGALRAMVQLPSLDAQTHVQLRQALLKAILRARISGDMASISDERSRILGEIGDYLVQLAKHEEALAAYREGLSLKPDSRQILHKLLEVHGQLGAWKDALDVLNQLITLETAPRRRARFHQMAALVARDELADPAQALKHLLLALDDDETLDKARESLEPVALTLGDPKELLRVYQRKLKFLGADAQDMPKQRAERLRLWTALSQLCIQQLGDVSTGIAAYEVTVALDGNNLDRRRQLANMYSQAGGGYLPKAINEHHQILAQNKNELASYLALRSLYTQSEQREKGASVAVALHLLGRSSPEDQLIVDEQHAKPLKPATRPLSKELWRHVTHPQEDPRLAAVFVLLRDATLTAKAKTYRELGLQRSARLALGAPSATSPFFEKALRYAFEALDAPLPEVYARPDDPTLADLPYRVSVVLDREAGVTSPALVIELGPAIVNPRRAEREVTYEVARLAALLRPERLPRSLYSSPGQLALIVDAVIALAGPGGLIGPIGETAQSLQKALPPAILEQIKRVGAALRELGQTGETLVQQWLVYSDLTSVRAGMLLCGDLETVALTLATEPLSATRLPPKQRLLDSIHYTVTEDYFTARQHLGLMA